LEIQNKFNNNYLNVLLITFLLLLFCLPGLGTLEFFRHTEADRVLISQEMLETGEYLVPHLLSQPILTKPPIYYWASALSFKVLGDYSEFESRIISVLAAALLLIVHYLSCIFAGFSKKYSLCSALVLATTASFFILSTVAEIDMLYATFCAASLYLIYFSIEKKSLLLTLLSYFAAALAFLVKGPPVLVFFAFSSVAYFLVATRSAEENKASKMQIKSYFLYNILGILLFLLVSSFWFVPFINQIGLSNITAQFQEEILGRAFGKPRLNRGVLFYFKSVFVASCPWGALFFFPTIFFKESKNIVGSIFTKIWNNNFIKFCILVFVTNFIFLSLAKGKTSRYIFPLHAFFIQVLFYILYSYREMFFKKNAYKIYMYVSFLLFSIVLVAAIYFKANFLFILPSLIFLVLVFYSVRLKKFEIVFASFVLFLFSVQLLAKGIYYPLRNQKKSVKPIVKEIKTLTKNSLIKSSTIYSALMYERWVQYYLKREGFKVVQLQGSKKITPKESRINWLITNKDENDLLELIKKDSGSKLVKEFEIKNTSMFLYNTDTSKALGMIEFIQNNRKHEGTF